jgi:hypothetical protein
LRRHDLRSLQSRHCEERSDEAIEGNAGRAATLDRRVASLLAMTGFVESDQGRIWL